MGRKEGRERERVLRPVCLRPKRRDRTQSTMQDGKFKGVYFSNKTGWRLRYRRRQDDISPWCRQWWGKAGGPGRGVLSAQRREQWEYSVFTQKAVQVLLQALVISHLDYRNSLLAGLPASAIRPLQLIQKAAARIVFNLNSLTLLRSSTPFTGYQWQHASISKH